MMTRRTRCRSAAVRDGALSGRLPIVRRTRSYEPGDRPVAGEHSITDLADVFSI
jgi:hypothetical protein